MISNLRPAFLIVVAVGLLCAARQVQAAQAGPDRAGYELLERLVAAVAVAARPAPGATDISPELLRLARIRRPSMPQSEWTTSSRCASAGC